MELNEDSIDFLHVNLPTVAQDYERRQVLMEQRKAARREQKQTQVNEQKRQQQVSEEMRRVEREFGGESDEDVVMIYIKNANADGVQMLMVCKVKLVL
jgi:hypothetical protein